MGVINIHKRDLIWSYIAKFFSLCSGLIMLPYILTKLSPEEVGMNYLMLSVTALVSLLDFGFSPQFGRNFTYINSGAQQLLKNEVDINNKDNINYRLLSTLLKTAKYVYAILSTICLIILLTFGTIYIYHITSGFTNIPNILSIWLLFSFSTSINIYFSYYNSLLTGSGQIAEANKAIILSKSVYLFLCFFLLSQNVGLMSLVIANFIAPIVLRVYSYHTYFTKDLKLKLSYNIEFKEIKETFSIIWYNSKKLGIYCLGSYAITQSGMFLMGLFLPLSSIASYGIMLQFVNAIAVFSQLPFATYQPKFSSYVVTNNITELKILLTRTMLIYWIFMIVGCICLFLFLPAVLVFTKSQTELPENRILLLFMLSSLLENNQNCFTTLITVFNKIPYLKSSLMSGLLIVILTTVVLKFTSLAVFGVVLVKFIVQLSYNNWRWPKWIFDYLNFSFLDLKNILLDMNKNS